MTAARSPASSLAGPTSQAGHLRLWIGAIALAQFAALVSTSTRYGYHRDEMYFIASGAHPAFGYPDQPPIVPLICWAMNELASGSLLVLRLPSALAAAATTVIAALVAREVGGTGRAQTIAAACTATSGFALAVGHFVTTTTFDLLSTSAVCLLMIQAITRKSGPALLAAGIVTGVGFQAKPQVALVAALILAILAISGPRWVLRSPWLAAGVGAALVLAAPYLIWQTAHGWPQLTVAGNVAGSAEGGRIGFVPFQFVLVSPVLAPVWIAGLIVAFRRPELRSLRFVPLTYGLLAIAYLAADGKAYYLASMYPVVLGLGALPVADWTTRRRIVLRLALLDVGVVVSAAVSALIALPLLPTTSLQGSIVIAINPDQGETVGWPQFIDTVVAAWKSVPDQAHSVIFTGNYGEAGAIDLLGHSHGLPRAYSGHNGFSEWGEPGPDALHAMVIGYSSAADAAPYFVGCSTLAIVNNGVGLDNQEQGMPLLLCSPAASWSSLWPKLRHYD